MYIHSLQKKKLTFYQGSLKAEAERKWVPKKKKKNLPILRYGEREREKGEKSTLFTSVFLTFFLSKKNPSHTTIEAISSHQTPLGEKKKKKKRLAPHWRFDWSSLSPFEFSRYVLLSLPLLLSMIFCCFDSVLKLLCDFGISFSCFRQFTEYSRFVLRLKPYRFSLQTLRTSGYSYGRPLPYPAGFRPSQSASVKAKYDQMPHRFWDTELEIGAILTKGTHHFCVFILPFLSALLWKLDEIYASFLCVHFSPFGALLWKLIVQISTGIFLHNFV